MTNEEKKAIEWFEDDLKNEKARIEYKNDYTRAEIKRDETILNLIQKLQEENKKKDKIIDEMTCELSKVEPFEDICKAKKNNNKCEHCCNLCIKQYFEKKVEE